MKSTNFYCISKILFWITIFQLVLTSCEKETTKTVEPDDLKTETEVFSKDILVADSLGNHVLLRLSSSEKDIIDSYSEQNYVLTPLTQSDIDLMLAEEPSQSTDMDSDDMDDFNFEGDQAIRITEEVLEEHLSSNYKTYMLTVKWIAPESYENRGFDWNAKSKTSMDFAYLKNNRCCWAIYWKCDVWKPDYYMIAESELKGGNFKNGIGERGSDYIQLHIKYRQDKHYSYYYYN